MRNQTTITAKTDTTRAMLILASSVFGGRVTEVPPQEPVEVGGEDYFMNIAAPPKLGPDVGAAKTI